MLRKKTVRRWIKRHLKNVQITDRAVVVMQKSLDDIVDLICVEAFRIYSENNTMCELQRLKKKKRLSSDNVRQAINKLLIAENDVNTTPNIEEAKVDG